MSNVLDNLIPTLYAPLDEVSRELIGFLPSVTRNSSAERAAVGEEIKYPISRPASISPITPSMTMPTPDGFENDMGIMKITRAESAKFPITGEETQGLRNGLGVEYVLGEQFKQALRTLTNTIEADIANAAYKAASRAYGTASTDPFASNINDVNYLRQILDDNGAPLADRSLIINSNAALNLRNLTALTSVADSGTEMTLRQGELLNLSGFSIKESAQIKNPTIGTAATVVISDDAYAVGATSIKLKSVDTAGPILAGDIITFAGDTNKYVVTTGVATAAADSVITIAKPGLRIAIGATSNKAISIVAKSARNIGFVKNAIQLVTRAPALPQGGDASVDSFMITDPRSGMAFDLRVYKGYKMQFAEIGMAWGVAVIKPENVVTLLGR